MLFRILASQFICDDADKKDEFFEERIKEHRKLVEAECADLDGCQLHADPNKFNPFSGCVGKKNTLFVQYKCHDGEDKTEVFENRRKENEVDEKLGDKLGDD